MTIREKLFDTRTQLVGYFIGGKIPRDMEKVEALRDLLAKLESLDNPESQAIVK